MGLFKTNATNIYLKTEIGSVILREMTNSTFWPALEDSHSVCPGLISKPPQTQTVLSGGCRGENGLLRQHFPFPRPPTQYETIPKYPPACSKAAFPRLSKPLLYFQRIYSEGKKAREGNLGPNTCPTTTRHQWPGFFVQGWEGSKARPSQAPPQSKDSSAAGSRECSLTSIPKSQPCLPQGQPCWASLSHRHIHLCPASLASSLPAPHTLPLLNPELKPMHWTKKIWPWTSHLSSPHSPNSKRARKGWEGGAEPLCILRGCGEDPLDSFIHSFIRSITFADAFCVQHL